LAGQPGAESFRAILDDLDRFVKTGLAPSVSAERAKQLTQEVSALIGTENPLPACQRLGEELRSIGAVQDGALARSRMAVRRLQQAARTLVLQPTPASPFVIEVRRMAEQWLRSKSALPAKEEGFKQ
jgi:hypothetical protein